MHTYISMYTLIVCVFYAQVFITFFKYHIHYSDRIQVQAYFLHSNLTLNNHQSLQAAIVYASVELCDPKLLHFVCENYKYMPYQSGLKISSSYTEHFIIMYGTIILTHSSALQPKMSLLKQFLPFVSSATLFQSQTPKQPASFPTKQCLNSTVSIL